MAILKVETNIIATISASPIGRAGIFVIWSVEAFRAGIFVIWSVDAFRTDVIVFINDVIMCFT